jgi:hypothetical protein
VELNPGYPSGAKSTTPSPPALGSPGFVTASVEDEVGVR